MTFLPVFCSEGDPVALDETFQYVVLSTLQWKDANLKVMRKAAKQRFAVLYNQPLEDRYMMETLEQAHIQGAMCGVKVVAVHKDEICLFLSDEVAAATLPAIESLWAPIRDLDLNRRLWVDFYCEHEVFSGRSDYPFWPEVKEILESNTLGIEHYQIPVLHDCAYEISQGDDPASHKYHVDVCQLPHADPVELDQFYSTREVVAFQFGHTDDRLKQYYVGPLHKNPDA